jgi:hypothetical protein
MDLIHEVLQPGSSLAVLTALVMKPFCEFLVCFTNLPIEKSKMIAFVRKVLVVVSKVLVGLSKAFIVILKAFILEFTGDVFCYGCAMHLL